MALLVHVCQPRSAEVQRMINSQPNSDPANDTYLSPADAAKYTGLSTRTIHRWIRSGVIPSYRYGRRIVRVRKSELDAVLRQSDEQS